MTTTGDPGKHVEGIGPVEPVSRTTATVALPPEIDITNAEQLCAGLCAYAVPGTGELVADMTATRFCDSAGLRMLLVVRDRLAATETEFTVVIPPDSPVMRALTLIGFDQILHVAPVA